jgi:hypothetical protein
VTNECGCVAYPEGDIVFCPLHASAKELLEALKAAIEELEMAHRSERWDCRIAISISDAAIKKAEGK